MSNSGKHHKNMESALISLPLETLQTKLSESIDALHRLNTGPTSASSGADRIEYAQKTKDLERYINQLQSAIARKQGGAGRGPIYLAF